MENNSVNLLRRLNPYCAQALAAAATLCQTRAHAEITIEHWLLKLLEQGEGDITVIARRYEWDMDSLWQGLLAHLDELPRSLQHKPQLSDKLQNLIKNAWLEASLQENTDAVRSVHLLSTLINQSSLLTTDAVWPLLSISNTQISRLLPLLEKQSDERSEIQNDWQQQQNSLEQSNDPTVINKSENSALNTQDISPIQQAHLAVLDKFTLDVTAKARLNAIDPIFGRNSEIRQMVDILSRRRKNNPILVGEPGVGKTALVEGLALRIVEGNVPESLKKVAIRTLDLGLLQAGAGVKGEFEQRLKNVIEAVQQSPEPILLFIDEAHTIIGAGNQAGGADAANLLKPALARGELRTIAATTWSEYKQYFERDAALERRFQMVKVDEPDDATAALMLRGLKERYASHHGVHIQDAAIKAAVNLSRRYITARQLPDKAVDLLDTASARVRMSLDTIPEELTQISAQLTSLMMEQQAIEQDLQLNHHEYYPHHIADKERLENIEKQRQELQQQLEQLEQQYQQERDITQQLLTLRKNSDNSTAQADLQRQLNELQKNQPLLSLDVDARTVATVIADWVGVPLATLLKDEQTNLLQLEHQLGQRVIGQETPLTALAQRLRAAKTGLTSENAPLGVFLLVGPSGVGKTETALALADSLFSGEKSLITINLSEYQEAHTVSQLKGSPPGYVGYGEGGILTEAVRKRPYSVVLLDEVEKAHRDVLNLFYQVFDRGFMRDGEGREIDFRNTVILMTANLGSDELMALLEQQPQAEESVLHELLRPILRDHFQPALLARFQTLIYRPLNVIALKRIVAIKVEQVVKRLQRHYGLQCQIEESLIDTLVDACLLPDSGARNIDSLLNQQILPVISQQLLQRLAQQCKPKHLTLSYNDEEGIILSFDTDLSSYAEDNKDNREGIYDEQ